MDTITIEDKEYKVESLTENAKAQIANIQFADQEIARLQSKIAVFQTARSAYMYTLKKELEAIQ